MFLVGKKNEKELRVFIFFWVVEFFCKQGQKEQNN